MKWSSPLSDGDLLKYSADHVAYEVEMFFTVGQSVLHNAWATPNDRALLESFIVHLRSLMDFLYPTSGLKPTDIIAAYYFKEKSSWQATPSRIAVGGAGSGAQATRTPDHRACYRRPSVENQGSSSRNAPASCDVHNCGVSGPARSRRGARDSTGSRPIPDAGVLHVYFDPGRD